MLSTVCAIKFLNKASYS